LPPLVARSLALPLSVTALFRFVSLKHILKAVQPWPLRVKVPVVLCPGFTRPSVIEQKGRRRWKAADYPSSHWASRACNSATHRRRQCY
jgi:hypothetical protein